MLRVMLNQAATIDAPHPPFIMEKVRPFQSGFGDLQADPAFEALIEKVCQLTEKNHVPWDAAPFDRDRVKARCRERSVVGVFDALMTLSAEHHGKESWLCKASGNVHFLPELEAFFGEDARFLHLVRDGRDVMTSYMRAVVGEKTAYHIAKQWAEEQRLCVALQQRVPAHQFLSVRYEDILANPEQELRRICTWLGIGYTPAMVDFHESSEAQKTACYGQLWTNLKRPVIAENRGKWREGLTEDDVLVFESVAHDMLEHFGYPCSQVSAERPALTFSAEEVRRLTRVNNQNKRQTLAKIPARDLAIRAPQDEVIRSLIRLMPDVSALRFPTGSVVLPLWKDVMRELGQEVDDATF